MSGITVGAARVWRCPGFVMEVFVANMIAFIQELTTSMVWNYVSMALNPADILSRGPLPYELCEFPVWIHGQLFQRRIGHMLVSLSSRFLSFVEVYCCQISVCGHIHLL